MNIRQEKRIQDGITFKENIHHLLQLEQPRSLNYRLKKNDKQII